MKLNFLGHPTIGTIHNSCYKDYTYIVLKLCLLIEQGEPEHSLLRAGQDNTGEINNINRPTKHSLLLI